MSLSLPQDGDDVEKQNYDRANAAGGRIVDDGEMFIRAAFQVNPEKGLELLFREYYQPLCSHAIRFVFSAEVAKDIVAEIFCNFLQKAHFLKVERSYRYYLYRSVRNDCLKYLQREVGRSRIDLGIEECQDMPGYETPESLLGCEELSRRIDAAIANLPPQCRRVFVMNRYEGLRHHEIACELNVSLKTVEAHITKSLKAIRLAIRDGWDLW
ncbi:RNA polymerase sigma-70 factor [Ravibacter arvi]|uniref:RNA polymerase sigma-70 factor n=1 Tax=Ravibacter arvi TaxID=2051041 RepID=A0ABP8MB17_9BACT